MLTVAPSKLDFFQPLLELRSAHRFSAENKIKSVPKLNFKIVPDFVHFVMFTLKLRKKQTPKYPKDSLSQFLWIIKLR